MCGRTEPKIAKKTLPGSISLKQANSECEGLLSSARLKTQRSSSSQPSIDTARRIAIEKTNRFNWYVYGIGIIHLSDNRLRRIRKLGI